MSAKPPAAGAYQDPNLMEALDALRLEMDARRLGIFREHIGTRVSLASPLLLDACRPMELDDAAWRLRPPPGWPASPRVQVTVRGWSARSAFLGPVRTSVSHAEAHGGQRPVVADMLVLRIGARSANMVLRVGETVIHTADHGGRLMLPGIMSPDRREELMTYGLDQAFDHPILVDREYIVRAVTQDAGRMRTIVEFSAAPTEWRLPWARPLPHWVRRDDLDGSDDVPF